MAIQNESVFQSEIWSKCNAITVLYHNSRRPYSGPARLWLVAPISELDFNLRMRSSRSQHPLTARQQLAIYQCSVRHSKVCSNKMSNKNKTWGNLHMFLDILKLGVENKTKSSMKTVFVIWPQSFEKMPYIVCNIGFKKIISKIWTFMWSI